jgi:hypothetical protein
VEQVLQLGQRPILVMYTLKPMYYAYFHSVTKYGIILGGNSSYSGKNFTLQKKIIRIMAVAQPRTSCRSIFNQLRDPACSMPVYTVINELHYL